MAKFPKTVIIPFFNRTAVTAPLDDIAHEIVHFSYRWWDNTKLWAEDEEIQQLLEDMIHLAEDWRMLAQALARKEILP